MPINQKVTACDVVIIGAGIVGIAIARTLSESHPNLRIVILEKEALPGLHASGRNSGVLHAGFYYSPDSLKAQFCREGNLEMRKLAAKHKVSIKSVGKVVVAQNSEEIERLHLLYERGLSNNVELQILDEDKLSQFEPLARTHKSFLWSPTTAIADKTGILFALLNEIKERNVQFLYNQKFISIEDDELKTQDYKIKYKHLVNASGSGAVSIAHKMGFGINYKMIPFLGVYRATTLNKLPLRRLVYPVPHPEVPFLGTHFTITSDNLVKIGPTAQPILFSEQYKFIEGWNFNELITNPLTMLSYFANNISGASKLIRSEVPQLIESELVKKSAKLVPSVSGVKTWEKKPSGIRAQLLRVDTKALEQDFVVQGDSKSTHLLNIVSPGWTSSIPFAKWIVEKYIIQHL